MKKILTEDKNVNVSLKRVTRTNSSKDKSRTEKVEKTLNGDDSSQLLQHAASSKNINLDTSRALSPTKIVVGHSSKLSGKEVTERSS